MVAKKAKTTETAPAVKSWGAAASGPAEEFIPTDPAETGTRPWPDDAQVDTQRVATEDYGEVQQAQPEEPPAETSSPQKDPPKKRSRKATKAEEPGKTMETGGNYSNAAKALVGYVERVERLLEERQSLNEDIKEVFSEVKSAGYNVKIVREVMRRRNWGEAAIKEHDSLIELYEEALR